MTINSLSILGSGRLASHLGPALSRAGFTIRQIYSRNLAHAENLAQELGAQAIDCLDQLNQDSDCYLILLADSGLEEIAKKLKMPGKLVLHSSGTSSLSLIQQCSQRTGVLYPLQSFSQGVKMNFGTLPFFIESHEAVDLSLIEELAKSLSKRVYLANSTQRKQLHLAAVFASNFSNHMYVLAQEILKASDLPLDVLNELICQTSNNALTLSPLKAQTGPASRFDQLVLNEHLNMLKEKPEIYQIYAQISQSIQHFQLKNRNIQIDENSDTE